MVAGILFLYYYKDHPNLSRVLIEATNTTCIKNLEDLSQHENDNVRARVALNIKCPAHVLKALATDKNMFIREYVVFNRNCNDEVFMTYKAAGLMHMLELDKWMKVC